MYSVNIPVYIKNTHFSIKTKPWSHFDDLVIIEQEGNHTCMARNYAHIIILIMHYEHTCVSLCSSQDSTTHKNY